MKFFYRLLVNPHRFHSRPPFCEDLSKQITNVTTMRTSLEESAMNEQRNVFGEPLQTCSMNPLTGFTRSGSCETGAEDLASYTVCARVTRDFLEFSKSRHNDLTTPMPEFDFPGLKEGDRWCVCAARWKEAFEAGCPPRVVLQATHERVTEIIDLQILRRFAIDVY